MEGVEIGAEERTTVPVPGERRAIIAGVARGLRCDTGIADDAIQGPAGNANGGVVQPAADAAMRNPCRRRHVHLRSNGRAALVLGQHRRFKRMDSFQRLNGDDQALALDLAAYVEEPYSTLAAFHRGSGHMRS